MLKRIIVALVIVGSLAGAAPAQASGYRACIRHAHELGMTKAQALELCRGGRI